MRLRIGGIHASSRVQAVAGGLKVQARVATLHLEDLCTRWGAMRDVLRGGAVAEHLQAKLEGREPKARHVVEAALDPG